MTNLREYVNKSRHDFEKLDLDIAAVKKDPFDQFEIWLNEAMKKDLAYANAFVLSTASKEAKPSSRVLLLRNVDKNGFVFYTNYHSRKSQDITENPFASIVFFWRELERQVRVEGELVKQDELGSDEYFDSRPRGSQLGAWSSPQSKVIKSREEIENKYKELEEKFKEKVPRPEHWGGYILKPSYFEFWQGRSNRMHDRIVYRKEGRDWLIERLAP